MNIESVSAPAARRPDEAQRRKFLDLFPDSLRPFLVPQFLEIIRRDDVNTPAEVVEGVRRRLRQRLGKLGENSAKINTVLTGLQKHEGEALGFARYLLDYEDLPEDERQAIRSDRALEHVQRAMSQRPPSGPQMALLKTLGYDGPEPQTMQEASDAIGRLKGKHFMKGGLATR